MSQNMGNQPSDSQGNSGRGSNNSQDSKRYEGFEGMNYEQVRQPYNSNHNSNGTRSDDSSGGSKRHDEL